MLYIYSTLLYYDDPMKNLILKVQRIVYKSVQILSCTIYCYTAAVAVPSQSSRAASPSHIRTQTTSVAATIATPPFVETMKVFNMGQGNCQAAKYQVNLGRKDSNNQTLFDEIAVMYDCGGSEYLNTHEIESFIYDTAYTFLILSHPEEDHIGKVKEVFTRYNGTLISILAGNWQSKNTCICQNTLQFLQQNSFCIMLKDICIQNQNDQTKYDTFHQGSLYELLNSKIQVTKNGTTTYENIITNVVESYAQACLNRLHDNISKFTQQYNNLCKLGYKVIIKNQIPSQYLNNLYTIMQNIINNNSHCIDQRKYTNDVKSRIQTTASKMINDLTNIYEKLKIKTFIENHTIYSPNYQRLFKRVKFLAANQWIPTTTTGIKDQNAASPIVSLTVKKNNTYCNLICTGDAEYESLGPIQELRASWNNIIASQNGTIHNLMVLSHHGSENANNTKVNKTLIELLKPKIAFVSGDRDRGKSMPHCNAIISAMKNIESIYSNVPNFPIFTYQKILISKDTYKPVNPYSKVPGIFSVSLIGDAEITGSQIRYDKPDIVTFPYIDGREQQEIDMQTIHLADIITHTEAATHHATIAAALVIVSAVNNASTIPQQNTTPPRSPMLLPATPPVANDTSAICSAPADDASAASSRTHG